MINIYTKTSGTSLIYYDTVINVLDMVDRLTLFRLSQGTGSDHAAAQPFVALHLDTDKPVMAMQNDLAFYAYTKEVTPMLSSPALSIVLPLQYGGTVAMPLNACFEAQIFHHKDIDGTYRHFHIGTLNRLIRRNMAKCPLVYKACIPAQLETLQKEGRIEAPRLAGITPDAVDMPGMICMFPGDEELIVDGNHRYAWRTMNEMEFMTFYAIPEAVWRYCLIALPDEYGRLTLGS